jgi:hypothetical protein
MIAATKYGRRDRRDRGDAHGRHDRAHHERGEPADDQQQDRRAESVEVGRQVLEDGVHGFPSCAWWE